MYLLFLLVSVAAVILSPLTLDWWLTARESYPERVQVNQAMKAKGPGIAWASARLR